MMRNLVLRMILLKMLQAVLAAPAWARAPEPPPVSVPPAPPGLLGCASGWQTASRTVGFDHGAGYLLEADFKLGQRSGRLLRRELRFGEGAGETAGAPLVGPVRWDAAVLLDGMASPTIERRIYTLSSAGATIPFNWASLGSGQQAMLDPAGDGTGPARLDYLRGARSAEGAAFRLRASLLGDIIRSAPLLVGPPAADNHGAAYLAFYQRYRQRAPLVYVGANDGMLHAFDWTTGAERFAYVPAALLPQLAKFADPASAAVHQPYVDGALAQQAALVDGQWRSVLVAGMGMGSSGLFALDVSDPATAPVALWEFTAQDDAAIGHIDGAPQIVRLRAHGAGEATIDRYFVLVSSGLNTAAGADGALFLLALDKPAGAPWRRGENYYRLPAPARDPAVPNALGPPVVAADSDGMAHSAWAGDLQGTLWRFDLLDLARTGSGDAGATRRASPLFRAHSDDGTAQPITAAPRVVFAPGGGFVVLFGTGKTIEIGDVAPASFVPQSFYAVRDGDRRPDDAAGRPVAGRAVLAQRRLAPGSGTEAFTIEGEQFDYKGTGKGVKQGWYFDYPRSLHEGERTAAAPQLSGSALVISTSAPGSQPCSPTVRAYVVDTLTGLAHDRRGVATPGALTGRAMNGSDGNLPFLMASTLSPAQPNPSPTGAVRGWRSLALFTLPPSGTGVLLDQVRQVSITGRLSWREIANWRELHANGPPPVPAPPASPP